MLDTWWLDGAQIPYRSFYRPELAFACALAGEVPGRVVMGDCLEYWVVSPADAERFQRAGYQVVEESPVGVWSTTGSSVGPFCKGPMSHRQGAGAESNDEHSAPRRDRE